MMKRVLLYGTSDRLTPWYEGFHINADGSIDIRLNGVNTYEIEKDGQEITWLALFNSKLHELCNITEINETLYDYGYDYPLIIFDKYIVRLWNKLSKDCNSSSPTETAFFDLYCELCLHQSDVVAFLPALIPHVYINWYSSKEKRNSNEEPYIVDFVFKSSVFGTDNLVVVEIDGPSHYANYDSTSRCYTLSEDKYAEHLKKDRWLRQQGFKVIRIGNSEISKIKSLPTEERLKQFYYFFKEIFGDFLYIEKFNYPLF